MEAHSVALPEKIEAAPGPSTREPQLDYVCSLIRAHNNKVLNNMLEALMRIMDEGDFRKMAAIQSLISFADPGEKKKERE